MALEILKKLHPCILTYSADKAAFPYGLIEDSLLIERILRISKNVVENHSPDILVIACNTASTLALTQLREQLTLPIVGVVPAIKPAAKSSSGAIGLLATPATVNRNYTYSLAQEFASDKQLLSLGSNILVEQAERYLNQEEVDLNILKQELQRLFDLENHIKIDTIILACTHFPIIKELLIEVIQPRQVKWVDSGEAIARRVEYLLGTLGADISEQRYTPSQINFSCTLDSSTNIESLSKSYYSYLCKHSENPLCLGTTTALN